MNLKIKEKKLQRLSFPKERISSFIRKTYEILDEAKYRGIVDWTCDGLAIVIKDTAGFAQQVLPIYFKHNNMTSFVRQLNMYDFHKKKTTGSEQVYQHDLFQKGKRQLLKQIRRKCTESSNEISLLEYQGDGNNGNRYHDEIVHRIRQLEDRVRVLMSENDMLSRTLYERDQYDEISRPLTSTFAKNSQNENFGLNSNQEAKFKKNLVTSSPNLSTSAPSAISKNQDAEAILDSYLNVSTKEERSDSDNYSYEFSCEDFKTSKDTKEDPKIDHNPKRKAAQLDKVDSTFEDLQAETKKLTCYNTKSLYEFDCHYPCESEYNFFFEPPKVSGY